ncbi:MAG TPA: hypothetical protein VHT05_08540 [Candidatus Elarobacter sp.]|jgi:hypothetical protein|nr:hypothetical protein [Candidatus Elarobacter sp.]
MKHASAPERTPAASLAVAGVTTEATLPPGTALDIPSTLPRDHPAWQRDTLSISSRVRSIVAALQPVVVRVLTFWDHVSRAVAIGPHHLEIDPSGSYRLR